MHGARGFGTPRRMPRPLPESDQPIASFLAKANKAALASRTDHEVLYTPMPLMPPPSSAPA